MTADEPDPTPPPPSGYQKYEHKQGWYPAPDRPEGSMRQQYWNGIEWEERTREGTLSDRFMTLPAWQKAVIFGIAIAAIAVAGALGVLPD